jgi:hypothetical protein
MIIVSAARMRELIGGNPVVPFVSLQSCVLIALLAVTQPD